MNTTTVYIATDIVQGILEGNTIDRNVLLDKFAECDVVLLKECVCKAMEEVEQPTVARIHGLANLICVAGIQDDSQESDDGGLIDGRPLAGFVSADLILAVLIGAMPLPNVMGFFALADRLNMKTPDVDLIACLLSVEEDDCLNLHYVAGLLRLVTVECVEIAPEERANWNWTKKGARKLQGKAIGLFMLDPENN